MGGVKTNHVWDGDQIALETDASGNVTNKYVRGINLLYVENPAGTKQYYIFNGHGDVVQLTGTGGTLTKNYDYDAFGKKKNPDTSDTNVFRYCGEYFDKETGTIYLRARYYDPEIGRFISEDSYIGKDAEPLSLNLYTYCMNNERLSDRLLVMNGYNCILCYIGVIKMSTETVFYILNCLIFIVVGFCTYKQAFTTRIRIQGIIYWLIWGCLLIVVLSNSDRVIKNSLLIALAGMTVGSVIKDFWLKKKR